MVEINKNEATVIKSKVKNAYIVKTKRKLYVDETAPVIALLCNLRDTDTVTD